MNIKNLTRINVAMSLTQQLIVTICGFILPRIILNTFGSDVNGLVSSINQFLGYVSLLEGGITGVVSASLYSPLVHNDAKKLSAVIKTANSFYKKISFIFVLYTVVVAGVYPSIVKTGYGYGYVFLLALILGINLFVQYCFSITWKTLLIADRKMYLVSLIYIGVVVVNTISTVFLVRIYPSIHFIKLVSAIIYFAQPFFYHRFVKQHYDMDDSVQKDDKMLSQRWDGFGINIAAFIHNNTDVIVLSLLATLSDVSVYSVYFLVVTGLKAIITAVSQGISPSLGQIYVSGDKDRLKIQFDKFESLMLFLTFFLFTVGGFGITPFVQIYTSGVADANYYQPIFGWILIIAEMIYCIREPYAILAFGANRFKQFTKIAYLEAIINIIISVVFVDIFGLIGVAIGTLCAMTFRTLLQILYLHKHILHESIPALFKKIVINTTGLSFIVVVEHFYVKECGLTIMNWITYCLVISAVSIIVYGIGMLISSNVIRSRVTRFIKQKH